MSLVKPLMIVMSRPQWRGMANIPAEGPVIIVANHMSHADPFALAHYVYDAGRWPQYLAKASVFRIPVVGSILDWVEQIPVQRGTVDARKALDQAVEAVKAGKCVLIYPEGTTTKEPDLWPMRGKTGAARLWLATGAPVVPVVMWGPERLFDPRTHRLRPVPRTPITVVAGPPLDLSRWDARRRASSDGGGTDDTPPTAATLQEITEYIMVTLRDMLVEIRGGTAPPLWSPAVRSGTQPPTSTGASGSMTESPTESPTESEG